VRVLTHIKKLDDCFGQFLVPAVCECGAVREIKPEALARLVDWSTTLKALALRMRCSRCGKKAADGCGRRKARRLAKFSFSKPPGIRNGFAVNRRQAFTQHANGRILNLCRGRCR